MTEEQIVDAIEAFSVQATRNSLAYLGPISSRDAHTQSLSLVVPSGGDCTYSFSCIVRNWQFAPKARIISAFEEGEVKVIGDEPANTDYDPGLSEKAVS